MIKGIHAGFSTSDAAAARTFVRDTLGLRSTDIGGGFMIAVAPEAEVACHEAEGPGHDVSFYCDDLEATMSELEGKGVRFTSPVKEEMWGRTTMFELPGGGPVMLYQAKYSK